MRIAFLRGQVGNLLFGLYRNRANFWNAII